MPRFIFIILFYVLNSYHLKPWRDSISRPLARQLETIPLDHVARARFDILRLPINVVLQCNWNSNENANVNVITDLLILSHLKYLPRHCLSCWHFWRRGLPAFHFFEMFWLQLFFCARVLMLLISVSPLWCMTKSVKVKSKVLKIFRHNNRCYENSSTEKSSTENSPTYYIRQIIVDPNICWPEYSSTYYIPTYGENLST
jgi:hypothetical protein